MSDDDGKINPYQPPASGSDGLDIHNRDKLVVLATFDNSIEAHMLKNLLAEREIPSSIANEISASSIIGLGGPISAVWVEVLIRKVDSDDALVVKQEFLDKKNDASPIPEWNCECGEVVDAGFAVCWSCQAEYKATP